MTSTKVSPKTYTEILNQKFEQPDLDDFQSQSWKFKASWSDSVQGTGNPHWRSKIKAGQDATTLRTGVKATYTSKGNFETKFSYIGNDLKRHYDGKETFSGFPWTPSIPTNTTLTSENVTKSASLSFLKDVKNATTAVSSGVILGELKQTVRQLRSPAYAIRNLISKRQSTAYKKYRHITIRDASRVAADTWLEIQLGLKPLLADSIAICDAIQRVAEKREFRSVSGYSQEEKSSSEDITSYYCSSGTLNAIGILKRQEKVTCRFKGSVSLETTWDGSIRSNFGLLPEDFIPTLWELVPWSFVIDYFADIGGLLNAASAATSQIRWFCGTTRSEVSETRVAKATSDNPDALSVRGGGKSVATLTKFNRGYVSPALPSMPEFRLPGVTQSFNILALMLANQRMWPNLR